MIDFLLHDKASIIFQGNRISSTQIREKIHYYKQALCGYHSVGVAIDRSPDILFIFMALLESGVPYMPIDLSMGDKRINYLLQDSQIDVLITNVHYVDRFIHNKVLALEELNFEKQIETIQNESDIAYILYTSGSTGAPKGVEILRTSLINFMEGVSRVINFTSGKTIACLTSSSFDIFFLESIMPLCMGLTVVLGDEYEQYNPKAMSTLLSTYKVNMVQITPSKMKLLYNYDSELSCLSEVSEIMLGGEQLPQRLLTVLKKRTLARIYNMYGPTETTIWSCISELTNSDEVDIGMPILNTQVYIIEQNLDLINNGSVGEIAIAGKGLALGYRNQTDLTKEKFVQLKSGIRVYRTGDLGNYLHNGHLQYVGRIDNQVKIRGYRVELEEIEKALIQYDGIKNVIVSLIKGDLLVAFYESEFTLNHNEIKIYLSSKLPEYMIPSLYVSSVLQLTINGKIDRKKTIEWYLENTNKKNINEEAFDDSSIRGRIYKLLSNKEICGNDVTILNDNTELQAVGIDSITFIRLVVAIEREFDIEFDDKYLIIKAFKSIKYLIDYVDSKL